jgi:hypothetical protein
MRLSESKILVDTLSEACDKAEHTGIIDVKALLSEEVCRFRNIIA